MTELLYLTCAKHRELIEDELPLPPALERAGLKPRVAVWDETDWTPHKHILIRTPWDYAGKAALFLEKMREATAQGANVMHSERIIRWNIDKNYLVELSQAGHTVVPTFLDNSFAPETLAPYFKTYEKLVIKPRTGAAGADTYKISIQDSPELLKPLLGRAVLIQPYVEEIATEGEYSFIFFEERFSHAVLKKPGKGEFRVQEIHGGTVHNYNPSQEEVRQAQDILKTAGLDTLYARVDVERWQGRFHLMELEIFEPQLFFSYAPGSADRLAQAVAQRCATFSLK